MDDSQNEFVKRVVNQLRDGLQTSSSSTVNPAEEDPSDGGSSLTAPAAKRLGDYILEEELGRGGMGMVYRAVHAKRGNRVALKTLPEVEPNRLHKFKREFRSMADISHPNLVALDTLEADGDQWFFTMELLEGGIDFLSCVRPRGTLDGQRLRVMLIQLMSGVEALHSRQIVHRDLKPGNVLVDRHGNLKLLDFGLVAELEGRELTLDQNHPSGTPAYMAPEQAITSEPIPASDWYSVGVMLYEALSGSRPFTGTTLQVLQAKQQQDAPSLPSDQGIPEDLAMLCMKLLARDPERRATFAEISQVINIDPREPPSGAAQAEFLIGRESQIEQLNKAFGKFETNGEPQCVLVSGRSGEGKTALTERFLASLQLSRTVACVSGRCYDRETVPFKALDSLIDGLCRYLGSFAEKDAAFLIPREISLLTRVFPVLNRVQAVKSAPSPRIGDLDHQQVCKRAFAALREMLVRISDQAPIVFCIDDLQWGDADSAEALFEIMRPPDAPMVFLIGIFRSDEMSDSPFLQRWQELTQSNHSALEQRAVAVDPLPEADCVDLFVKVVGQDSPGIRAYAAKVTAETGGNPFLLCELADCFDPHSPATQSMALHEVIEKKLQRLPKGARQLLETVAVSGKAIKVDEVIDAAGEDQASFAWINSMQKLRLLRPIGAKAGLRVDTYHDRIRETVKGALDPGRLSGLHLQLAVTIETRTDGLSNDFFNELEQGRLTPEQGLLDSGRVFDLAYHFDAAGEQRKALGYSILAAEQARRQFAPAVSALQFAMAQRNVKGKEAMSNSVKYRIAAGRAHALQLLGRYDQALEQSNLAISLTENSIERARMETIIGDTLLSQGELAHSVEYYERGLRRLGKRVPRSALGLVFLTVREILVQFYHTIFPGRLFKGVANERSFLINYSLVWLAANYSFRNTFKMLWIHLTFLNRTESIQPDRYLPLAYSVHSMVLIMIGWPGGRADRYRDRAMQMVHAAGDILNQGYFEQCNGIGHTVTAKYEQGRRHLISAIKAFDIAGDQSSSHLSHFHKGCCDFGLGNLGEAIDEARITINSCEKFGEPRTMCASWLWARATGGNLPFERIQRGFPNHPEDIVSTAHGLFAEGQWHLFFGRTDEALQTIERAARMIRENRCINAHMVFVLPLLARARRLHAATMSEPKAAAQMACRSVRAAKWGVRIARFFPAAFPESLRELALGFQAIGKSASALKYFEKSCKVAKKQGAKYEFARSNLLRAKLKHQLGIGSEAEVEKANSERVQFVRLIEHGTDEFDLG